MRREGAGEGSSSTKSRSYPPRKKLGPSTRQVRIADDVALQLVLLSKLFYLSASHRLLLNRWWLNGWPAADTQTSSYIYCQFKIWISNGKENHFAVNFINTAETPLQCDPWAQWLLFCDDVHFNYSPTEHWRTWNWFRSYLRPKVGWCALCMTNDWPSAKMHWSIIFSSVLTNA